MHIVTTNKNKVGDAVPYSSLQKEKYRCKKYKTFIKKLEGEVSAIQPVHLKLSDNCPTNKDLCFVYADSCSSIQTYLNTVLLLPAYHEY